MSLCEVCSGLLQRSEIKPGLATHIIHHSSVLTFLDAVEINCYICWRSYQKLDSVSQSFLQRLKTELRKLGHDGILSTGRKRAESDGWPSSFSLLNTNLTQDWETVSRKTINIDIRYRSAYISLIAQELKNYRDNDNRSMEIAFIEEAAVIDRSLVDTLGGFLNLPTFDLREHKAGNETILILVNSKLLIRCQMTLVLFIAYPNHRKQVLPRLWSLLGHGFKIVKCTTSFAGIPEQLNPGIPPDYWTLAKRFLATRQWHVGL